MSRESARAALLRRLADAPLPTDASVSVAPACAAGAPGVLFSLHGADPAAGSARMDAVLQVRGGAPAALFRLAEAARLALAATERIAAVDLRGTSVQDSREGISRGMGRVKPPQNPVPTRRNPSPRRIATS